MQKVSKEIKKQTLYSTIFKLIRKWRYGDLVQEKLYILLYLN